MWNMHGRLTLNLVNSGIHKHGQPLLPWRSWYSYFQDLMTSNFVPAIWRWIETDLTTQSQRNDNTSHTCLRIKSFIQGDRRHLRRLFFGAPEHTEFWHQKHRARRGDEGSIACPWGSMQNLRIQEAAKSALEKHASNWGASPSSSVNWVGPSPDPPDEHPKKVNSIQSTRGSQPRVVSPPEEL